MANSGEYRYIITILQRISNINDYGEEEENYVKERTTRANVLWSSGQRTLQNSEIFIPNQFDIIVHKYINIQDTTRIELQGKQYRVIEYHFDEYYQDIRVKIALIQD